MRISDFEGWYQLSRTVFVIWDYDFRRLKRISANLRVSNQIVASFRILSTFEKNFCEFQISMDGLNYRASCLWFLRISDFDGWFELSRVVFMIWDYDSHRLIRIFANLHASNQLLLPFVFSQSLKRISANFGFRQMVWIIACRVCDLRLR